MYSVSVCFHRQTLGIRAVLDTEPEANETFPVLLSSPSGGARLREAAEHPHHSPGEPGSIQPGPHRTHAEQVTIEHHTTHCSHKPLQIYIL